MSFPVAVIGGTGVFGRYIVEELLASPVDFKITVTGRNPQHFHQTYPNPSKLKFISFDLNQLNEYQKLLKENSLVILAAGPFQYLSTQLAFLAASANTHYFDLCDDPGYLAEILGRSEDLQNISSVLISGLSTLPALSLFLMEKLISEMDFIDEVQIGLFIGNNNLKGPGAVFSAIEGLCRQSHFLMGGNIKEIISWSNPIDFEYPAPIGKIPSYAFPTPDLMFFQKLYSLKNFSARLGFEWSAARASFKIFQALIRRGQTKTVRRLVRLFFPVFSRFHAWGSSRGCVTLKGIGRKNQRSVICRASLMSDQKAQRMASLPAVIAAEALARGEILKNGLLYPHQWISPDLFFERMRGYGMELKLEEIS